jgi:hypothetical protein
MFHVVVSAHHSCDDTEMSVGGDEDEVKGQLNGSDGGLVTGSLIGSRC